MVYGEIAPKPVWGDELGVALFASLDTGNIGKISKYTLIEHLHDMGIQSDDPRIVPLIRSLMQFPNAHTEITLEEFAELTKPYIVLIRKTLQGKLVIPDFPEYRQRMAAIFDIVKEEAGGAVASYIPQLAKVSSAKFGVSVCTIDGQRLSLGDAREYFSIQSISKTVSYCLALEEFGEDVVHRHVGREPSGSSFNAITLDTQNRPHNPMINAGAIMSCSMVKPGAKPAERFDYVLSVWERLAGITKPLFNNAVYLSEKQTADRNFALAYFMSEKKKFPQNTNLPETLDLYFQCCSLELTCEGMATVAATFAKGGVNPLTGERIFDIGTVKNCLSLMNSCGMYDFSGEFAFTIGLPAKSGVGGGLMIVIPNVMGLCVWAPPLDQNGNSVKGVRFCRELVRHFNFHNYDILVSGDPVKIDPRKKLLDRKLDGVVALCWAAAQGDLNEIQQLLASGMDITEADYDGRTPLHLAASEGHLKVVEFLLCHGALNTAKDRWGNTPLDDAMREGHAGITDHMRGVVASSLRGEDRL
jgi:glutaminase